MKIELYLPIREHIINYIESYKLLLSESISPKLKVAIDSNKTKLSKITDINKDDYFTYLKEILMLYIEYCMENFAKTQKPTIDKKMFGAFASGFDKNTVNVQEIGIYISLLEDFISKSTSVNQSFGKLFKTHLENLIHRNVEKRVFSVTEMIQVYNHIVTLMRK